jgi:hypothetical protein
MRPFMLLAVSAIALAGASFGQANAGPSAGAAGLAGAAGQLRLAEPVDRVCHETCRGDVCRTRCVDERVRDEAVHEREYREGDHRDRDRDERRGRKPGVELKLPGVNIEAH